MKKPNDYDATPEYTPTAKLPAGGYVCIIKDVEDMKNKNGGDMIRIAFDIAVGDYRHYFSQEWERKKKFAPDANYPFCGQKWVNTTSAEGNTNRIFKSFIECFKKSNECDIDWDAADFGKQFVDMYIGIVFREEEDEYQGRKYTKAHPYYFLTVEDVKEGRWETPKEKRLDYEVVSDEAASNAPVSGFYALDDDVPDSFQATDEAIPF